MRRSTGIILLLILTGTTLLLAKVQRPFDTWRQSGGGGDSSQYSSLKQINRNNVKQLEVAWTYPTGPARTVSIRLSSITSCMLHPPADRGARCRNRKEIWKHCGGAPARGINFWESADHKDQRLVVHSRRDYELNAETGDVVMDFGQNGRVNAGLA
jgi:quinoprotein glucose dehydrogenase